MSKKSEALMSTYLKDKEKVAVIHSAFEDSPRIVAFVEVKKSLSIEEKLDIAFVKTNSLNEAWWDNKGVTAMFPDETCRSTSVGDIVLIGNVKYTFAPTGIVGAWTRAKETSTSSSMLDPKMAKANELFGYPANKVPLNPYLGTNQPSTTGQYMPSSAGLKKQRSKM